MIADLFGFLESAIDMIDVSLSFCSSSSSVIFENLQTGVLGYDSNMLG
jgi:hypothetical protein